jgi:hypothetical protein
VFLLSIGYELQLFKNSKAKIVRIVKKDFFMVSLSRVNLKNNDNSKIRKPQRIPLRFNYIIFKTVSSKNCLPDYGLTYFFCISHPLQTKHW